MFFELLLEGTIFWQVVDVPRMIERTGDPKGDVWYHARSSLIQAVSAVTLEQFMASFNAIVSRAAATDAAFYEQRGVRLHGLEVVRYECADGKTAGVLQEIIQETTNRINRLQKQKSENEVTKPSLLPHQFNKTSQVCVAHRHECRPQGMVPQGMKHPRRLKLLLRKCFNFSNSRSV